MRIDEEPFDGETACRECGVVICAFCQGQDNACPNAHAGYCKLAEFLMLRAGGLGYDEAVSAVWPL